jgi:alpha-1,6-mannosyltransferase
VAGVVALGTLAVAAIPLVAPGAGLVPGTDAGSPRWLLGPYGDGFGLDSGEYRTVLWVAFAAYLVVVVCASGLGRRAVRWAAILAVLAFALAPPLLSLDVFSYLSYARLGVLHGLNPYDFAPAAIAHDSAAARVQDYRDAASVYGPLFTLGSYPLGLIGVPAGMWAMKALAAGSVLAIAGLVARLATARGLAPAPAAALVALNPVVLVNVVGGAHNDALMMLALVGGVALVLGARGASGGVSMVAAAAIKLPAAVAAPFAFLGAGAGGRPRLLFGLAAAVAAMTAVALALFGTSVGHGLEFLSGSQQHVSYHSLPATVGRGLGVDVDVVRGAFAGAYGVLLVWLLIWTARGGDWIRAAGWAMLGLLCATIYLVPWYVLWVLPLAAVARDRLLVILTLGLCAYQLPVALPG